MDKQVVIFDDKSGTWSKAPEIYGSIAFETQEAFEEALDVLKTSKWISCKDEMPEDNVNVLICSNEGIVSKASYTSCIGYFYVANSGLHYDKQDITHWQPLPKPPKTKKE